MKENSKAEFVNRVNIVADKEYVQWIAEIKQRFKSYQAKAIVRVNAEMLSFYWSIGRDLVVKKVETVYGKGIMANLSKDLKDAFPEQTGFSIDNLYFMKRWYLFYTQNITIFDQAGQNFEMPQNFALVPWRHHIDIIKKCSTTKEALFYINKTIEGNWSRRMLEDQIEKYYSLHKFYKLKF